MSELPVRVWKNIAESRQARIDELEAALRKIHALPTDGSQPASYVARQGQRIARRVLEADR